MRIKELSAKELLQLFASEYPNLIDGFFWNEKNCIVKSKIIGFFEKGEYKFISESGLHYKHFSVKE